MEAFLFVLSLNTHDNNGIFLFSILFTDGGGKLLLTQVVSPRYAIQDDRVLFLLFELCQCLRIVVSDY